MNKLLYLSVGLGFVLLVSIFAVFDVATPVQAAPEAAPTPVSVTHSGKSAQVLLFLEDEIFTADGAGVDVEIPDHEKVDLQVVLDMGTVNTTTLKLQFSNDRVNWTDGATVGNALVEDTNTLAQHALFGRYARIYADLTNANPVTVRVIGVGK